MMEHQNDSMIGKELAYDLRQIYANLVGEHLFDVAMARKANKYSEWFENLEDLHTVIRHKFKDTEKNELKYQELVKKVIDASNAYEQEWTGKGYDAQGCATIKKVLRDIEMFLFEMMEKANLFGSNSKIQGL